MKPFLRLMTCSTAIAFSLLAEKAIAANFTFTKIADTTDGFGRFLNSPALNDNGTVAFSGTLNDGSTGVFTGSGGTITPIAVSGTRSNFQSVLSNPSINNAGTVAFGATTDSRRNVGVFTGSGNGLTTIATLNNAALSDRSYAPIPPAINDAGTVAFAAYQYADSDPNQNFAPTPNVLISSNGQLSAIELKTNESSAIPTVPNSVAINNANTVVFSSGFGGSLGFGGLFAKVGDAPLTTLANGGVYPVSLNNQGTYATAFAGAGGSTGILIGDSKGGPTARVIYGQSGFSGTSPVRVSQPAINDQGKVVLQAEFIGSVYPSPQGLFFENYTDANKIIATGDPLFGSTVSAIGSFSTRGLNNLDQVVFYSQLADGRAGIFRAEPVPEPQTVIPSVLFILGFGARQLMKRRASLSGRR
ncbi:choice-of-anchor tandem repeat NxxGxxAF-containing protein [Phormidesmis sp. 146-12]